jgi:hypothetical protein
MAAVDPKELLVRNKVLVIAYVLALVPIVLWFVVVDGGAKAEFGAKAKDLESAASAAKGMAGRITKNDTENPVFTSGDVEALGKRQEAFRAELSSLVDVVNSTGGDIEDWFEAFKNTKEGQSPNTADYLTEWSKQCNLLAERYKPLLTAPTGESLVYNEQPAGDALRRFQKRFWVQEAILEALARAQEGNPGLAIRMVARLDFPAPNNNPAPGEPAKPYEPIPARVTILCPFPRLPMVIRELLARKIPMRVTSLRVDKEQFAYESSDPRFSHYDQAKPRFSVDGREYVFQADSYPVTLSAAEHYEGGKPGTGQERWLPEPRVKVELMVEAYDFNKNAPPAPPAPPE